MRFTFLTILALSFALFSCNNAPEGKKVDANDAQSISETTTKADTFVVNTTSSVINWQGTEPGDEGHNGNIMIKSGQLLVTGNEVKGGEFVIDMTSINVLDLTGKKKASLEGHLKEGDFFEADKFPEAKFVISEVRKDSGNTYSLTGNLGMKDSVKSITIPATIAMAEGKIEAQTMPFTIDRTQWGIMYRSGLIGTLKNKLINDQIGITINLVAENM